MSFIQWCCEREAKFHVAKEISGRGQTRSRDEKGNQGVGDFRFINILQLVSIYFFFSIILLCHFFSIRFLPTTFTHTHTHDPRPTPTTHDLYPLPTTHDPRHLVTLVWHLWCSGQGVACTCRWTRFDSRRCCFLFLCTVFFFCLVFVF